jgi:hypothetical protein
MSTPDQPDTPPLTRKQLRELRDTGSHPIVPATVAVPTGLPAAGADVPPPVAPLPRPAEPVAVPPAPAPDASVDLGASPLTRRQARQQERIRTASVPVITPDFAAAHAAATDAAASATASPWSRPEPTPAPAPSQTAAEPAAQTAPEPVPSAPQTSENWWIPTPTSEPIPTQAPVEAEPEAAGADPWTAPEAESEAAEGLEMFESEGGHLARDDVDERPVLNPAFGSGLLAGAQAAPAPSPTSFDQLLSRDTATTGSVASPSTLIVSQAPSDAPLTAPIASTGEVLVTGTFALPDGLGSTGHAPGTADGKEVDAVLVDGELPAHSSPTPIAASAAISTVKTSDEIIRPPAPEKGNKLMLTLAITAGVLALALVGVLILAFVTGVFS